jgi:transposase-like protein
MAQRKNLTEVEKKRQELVKELLEASPVKNGEDLNNLMKEFIAQMVGGVLQGEMDDHLGYEKYDTESKDTTNSRNGFGKKTLHTGYGDANLNIPRDRDGEFDPVIIKKYEKTVNAELERKIISMYAKGMTTSDMEAHIKDMYGLDISDSTISRITDRILPLAKEWQSRPLEEIYAVVFLDAIHYNVRQDGRIIKKAVYIAIGIDIDGKKDVLGLWIGENESSKFWLGILNGLKNRGVEDILITCVDGLTGFNEAISAAFPKTEIQRCVIHQIRNSTKYVSYKDIKKLMVDLKRVYKAPTEETAMMELEQFDGVWGKKYPKIAESWRNNWPELSTYFKYPQAVRTLIYTTNTIENFNRQLRKVTKNKSIFPTDDSLFKMLYLVTTDITKKWNTRRKNWGEIHSQLAVYFDERVPY